MYHYVEDKKFLKNMRLLCSDIVNQLVQVINKDGIMEVKAQLVGSGAKGLETQNANEPIDLDYNVNIIKVNFDINDCKRIKEYIKKQFNLVLKRNRWSNSKDSTSVLSTEYRYFLQGNKTGFKIDLCIVREKNETWSRLIHEKTGDVAKDSWFWNQSIESKGLNKKVKFIKNNNFWNEVRQIYLKKKNMYLRKNDHDHPSFICYIETINEIYHAKGGK